MDPFYRPTWVEISLNALSHNLEEFRQALPDDIHLMAVVKADAYGHGAVEVSRVAAAGGVSYLAVAFLDEALELRRAGIEAPILVLGYTSEHSLKLAAQYGITITIYSREVLDAMKRSAHAAPNGRRLKVHVKIDTGMGRLGLSDVDEAIAYIEEAMQIPGVEVEGLFTHYASADDADKTYTLKQHARFERVVKHFRDRGIDFPFIHAGNSAAGIDTPELSYNMVRLGIAMYGLYPSDEVRKDRVELRPVMSLKTSVVMLKQLPPGSGVSYGSIYVTQGHERIATLPIGYADGFSRMLTGKAEALIRGRRVPVVGRICMDQCMINVTDVPDAALGDPVVLIGEQVEERIAADDLADQLGTINYEIVCMVSHRVPRVYVRDGNVVNTVNPLQHHGD